jgi:hypothetical protein
MQATEAAELISAIADGVRSNPSDFHIEAVAIGLQATCGGGGIGAIGIGNAPGATGISAHASTGDIDLRRGEAMLSKELQQACDELDGLAETAGKGNQASFKARLANLQASTAFPLTLLTLVERIGHLAGLN